MTPAERERLEREAMDRASEAQRKMLDQAGTLAAATRRVLLDTYALKLMKEGI